MRAVVRKAYWESQHSLQLPVGRGRGADKVGTGSERRLPGRAEELSDRQEGLSVHQRRRRRYENEPWSAVRGGFWPVAEWSGVVPSVPTPTTSKGCPPLRHLGAMWPGATPAAWQQGGLSGPFGDLPTQNLHYNKTIRQVIHTGVLRSTDSVLKASPQTSYIRIIRTC